MAMLGSMNYVGPIIKNERSVVNFGANLYCRMTVSRPWSGNQLAESLLNKVTEIIRSGPVDFADPYGTRISLLPRRVA